MSYYQHHVFICTNRRPADDPRGCCNPEGAPDLKALFKGELKARGLRQRIRPNTCGCLDACAEGPTVVVYPEAVWYRVAGVEDVRAIVQEHLVEGRPVERLFIRRRMEPGLG